MIRILLIICFTIGCNSSNQNYNSTMLECVLNSYISEFSVKRGSEIFVSDMNGWTDSTSLVRIMTVDGKDIGSGKIYSTEYKDIKIYLEYGTLKDNDVILNFSESEFSISNTLSWKIIELKNEEEEDDISPPEQFDEVQIIYNLTKNCIEESDMMGKLKFKQQINSECGFCR